MASAKFELPLACENPYTTRIEFNSLTLNEPGKEKRRQHLNLIHSGFNLYSS
ncbi:hypothetical protein PHJA_002324700 [Phtheirospermum japonicum]|uniref:Uncharacterized protein n=1 Tax=Phtheirospermum japonicum TaxID=374723 RepID=A0A830CMD7_9LAMI|nr:hypothetical protein PHJA_002324700 [Phtheirospermum japonicum]